LGDLDFEVGFDVGETVVTSLYSIEGCTSSGLLPHPALVLAVGFDLLVLLAVPIVGVFPMGLGMVASLNLLTSDCFGYLLVLQIQKHRLLLLRLLSSNSMKSISFFANFSIWSIVSVE
jgi:hypothetical protein